MGRRERNDGGEQATGDEGSETGRAGQNASRARENPPGGVSNGHIGNGDPGGSHASGAVENGLVSLDDSRGLANRHVRPSLTPAEGRRRNMSSPTGAVDQTSIGDAERGGASHHGSSDGGRELNTGDAHDEYDVYMDYNLLTGWVFQHLLRRLGLRLGGGRSSLVSLPSSPIHDSWIARLA